MRLTPAALRFYVIIAVLGTLIPNGTFYYSVAHLPAGIMSIIIATVPMLAFPLALALSSALHALLYATYVWLAATAGSVFAAQSSYLVTGAGMLWAMALLGERPAPTVWLALAVMLAGVALVQPRGRARRMEA
jgi:drug/metabolite transporter (DMT)-like permease